MEHAVDVDRYCSEVIPLLLLVKMERHTHTPLLIERRPMSDIWRSRDTESKGWVQDA